MDNNSAEAGAARSSWKPVQAYSLAAICLLLGVALGFLFRGSEGQSAAPSAASAAAAPSSGTVPNDAMHQMPTLEQMKQMGDKQAGPLLAKLKADPKNAGLLIQVAHIYESVHEFKEAADYYGQALAIDPKNAAIRTELASCLYYSGDVDGALSQLQSTLKDDPKNANSLFNLGLIRWKGKNDAQGALSAWQQLLTSNPTLDATKKVEVEKLIAQVKIQTANPSTP
jgi:cytochrome c-type biogenesis protein CcmH/NrfG